MLNSLFPEIQHFYPRPPRGGRHVCNWFNQNAIKFLSTPSARRATSCRSGIQENSLKFLSTPSARRATAEHKPLCGGSTFLSTPSARRATACCQSLTLQLLISIHALREEGDLCSPHLLEILEDFYPRPPRGGRLSVPSNALRLSIFLSTPSARRATWPTLRIWKAACISIHALREEGDDSGVVDFVQFFKFLSTPSARRATGAPLLYRPSNTISIHALREEGDYTGAPVTNKVTAFLSTPSARRATINDAGPKDSTPISIHALREEGD